MTRNLPLNVGEPAPWFSASTGTQLRNTIAFDELAGRLIVLFFFGTAARPSVAEALSAFEKHDDLFDGKRALFVGVSNDPDDFRLERVRHDRAGQLFLFDSTGAILRRYVAPEEPTALATIEPAAFILSPALQIIEIVRLAQPTGFVGQIVSKLTDQLDSPPSGQAAPVLIIPQVFDPLFCRKLVDLHEANGGREIGVVENEGKIVRRFDPTFRKRLDHYIVDEDALRQARESLARRLLPLVYRAFQFSATRIERYLVACYDATTGGHFKPHRDNTAPMVAHRRFAVTINLNETFEGGYLNFPEFNSQTYRTRPGDAIVFSCSLLHEVTPVTRHRRYAFVSFLYDEISQQIREKNSTSLANSDSMARRAQQEDHASGFPKS
ncbi:MULTISPECIES: 2OG-Fe(II) oxygenase [unclassified Bradyrhizobium]|uniref:2OG-Fe(II) oxygenase n=1 Tax=unclassified Bradyrhizobium TaxID=2631580 RepID=UPI001FF9D192|nr:MULTISPECIES: 2OG-Fe(II) oxygenase [unclassified Bradyrhizobium]MCK1313547.1 2OG-Fe(II) oxygenase [Bradyrhizobium sp. 23]MCK1450490.1 2OG-Fe(II) oxygenase [Bradyrhizobium sp. 35]MCK1507601.1 2OG-Fe(II) oxygenase [Bradyrhizobium sp. 18]